MFDPTMKKKKKKKKVPLDLDALEDSGAVEEKTEAAAEVEEKEEDKAGDGKWYSNP